MLRFMRSLFVAVVVFSASTSFADRTTGNGLLSMCEQFMALVEGHRGTALSREELVDGSYCLGFLRGMIDMNQMYRLAQKTQPFFCSPRNVANGQGARIIMKYLKEHPEELHEDAAFLTVVALREAFPCPR